MMELNAVPKEEKEKLVPNRQQTVEFTEAVPPRHVITNIVSTDSDKS